MINTGPYLCREARHVEERLKGQHGGDTLRILEGKYLPITIKVIRYFMWILNNVGNYGFLYLFIYIFCYGVFMIV